MPTSPTFFDDHDLHRLLMATPQAGAEGFYDHAYWSVRFEHGTPQALQQLATLHESMHMALNDSTAFGSLLHVYAALLRSGVEPERNGRVMDALIRQCRESHESFATWASVVAVGQGKEDSSLLAGYPRYVLYFAAASALLRGLDGAFVRNCAANAVFRLCMQGTGLDMALRSGLEVFDPERLPLHAQPDQRLEALTGLTDGLFWASAWEALKEECKSHPQWARLEAHQAGEMPFADLTGRDMDSLESAATEFFYAFLAHALAGVGLPSLDFNGHQAFTAELVDAVNLLYSDEQAEPPLVAAPPGPVDDEREQIERFSHERYQIRDIPFTAVFRRFSDLDGQPFSDLLAGPNASPHLFVAIRQGLWLLQHYRFDAESTALLERLRFEPIVAVRRRQQAGDQIDLVWLENPDDFANLLTLADDIPIYASLSLTSLAIFRWATLWYKTLRTHCRNSLLFDLSPFVQLKRWSEPGVFDIRYAFLNVASEGTRHVVFLCKAEDGLLPPLLAPCSEMTAKAIGYSLGKLASEGQRFVSDKTLVNEMGDALGLWLGHLLREETAFDFLDAQAVAQADVQHTPDVDLND